MELLAPRWDLVVNGRAALSEGYRSLVSSLHYETVADGADELRLECVAWDTTSQSYRILGERVLAPGNTVTLRLGYGTELVEVGRLAIVRHDATYPEAGVPSVSVVAYSPEYRLAAYTSPRSFAAPVTAGQVARQLAADHRLVVTSRSVADGPVLDGPRVKEAGTSDLEFLRGLCAEADFGPPAVQWEAGVGDVLVARPTRLTDQVELVTFRWRPDRSGTLISFAPSLSLAGAATRVEVIGWEEATGLPIRVVAELGEGGQETTVFVGAEAGPLAERHRSGSELLVRVLADGDDPRSEVRDVAAVQRIRTTEGALAWARRWLASRNRAWLTARAVVVGYPRLRAGQVHRFVGLAPEHSGLWEVVRCAHRIDESGYRCELDLDYVLDGSAPTREV